MRGGGGKFKLLSMAFHQHSPTVISGELINADTGELLCRNAPLMGDDADYDHNAIDTRIEYSCSGNGGHCCDDVDYDHNVHDQSIGYA